MTRLAFTLVLLSWPVISQVSTATHPWDSLFQDSWRAQFRGETAKARDLTDKAWAVVKRAGPAAAGYSDGVEHAYTTALYVSGALRAKSFYAEALTATGPARFKSVRLQILVRMAFRFTRHEEAAAKRYYEQALALAGSMSPRPKFYGHILNDFAELQERMGNPEEAVKLRARAISAPASEPAPYPLFGMKDERSELSPINLAPEIESSPGKPINSFSKENTTVRAALSTRASL